MGIAHGRAGPYSSRELIPSSHTVFRGMTGRRVDSGVGELWVADHPTLGPVIFNERSQRGMRREHVRLYKVNEGRTGTFRKAVVREKLVVPDDAIWSRIEPAVSAYIAALEKRRVTHCYNCKQHLDSVEFSVCAACGWLRCSCSACGCSYKR